MGDWSVTDWDKEADVVVIGSGATGLPAAVAASEEGASVILVEANWDIGGHAAVSGGNLAIGGGTSKQKEAGIEDSPDLVFADLTDWSVIEGNGAANYRYNDREIIRAFADNCAETFEWLVAHGVVFIEGPPDNRGAGATGNSAPRENHIAAMAWVQFQNGKSQPPDKQAITSTGIGLVRPLEAEARKLGVEILLETPMTSIIREGPLAGRVLGITATHQGKEINIRARRGVIIATGGSSGNVNFRRMFDPRLTEEYCGVAGEPYSFQDASGELAAIVIGGALWGTANQTAEFGSGITKPGRVGAQYGYVNLAWQPSSPVFDRVRAVGLRVEDWQDVILVNMLGRRFYDETQGQYTSNNYMAIDPYICGSYLNAANLKWNPRNFINAALQGIGDGKNGGGPIWAIFDADAVEREGWKVEPPFVDFAEGFCYAADTLAELAAKIDNKFQRVPMPAANLEAEVARYNAFVDKGADEDFCKPEPKYRIQRPPFYAAWATPVIHDTRCGLRINADCQVVDFWGNVIPGLYCGGESAGGFSMHGLARCTVQGRLAGINAAKEPPYDDD
jgi:succinate dehydrogenase/fumarate reductase flavoprotein subunit